MYSYGPPHMAKQKQDDQLKLTYSSYVRTQNVTLKTCQRRWMIGRSGERGSGISVLAAQHDDDDDDDDDIMDLKQFKPWNVPTLVGSIMLVSVLHSMWNLKATQMNVQHCVILQLLFYKFELGHNAAEFIVKAQLSTKQ